jgi:TetR/AcrR family tetracycline transcriptional repressor
MAAAASGKDGGRGVGLERDTIVREALSLLDEAGFLGLTQRRLADRLKVKAAALYWHFENKQELIDAIAERILLDEYARQEKPDAPMGWRPLLRSVAFTHRDALMRYRDGAQLVAHARMGNLRMMGGMERLLQSLDKEGFTPQQAMVSFFTIVRYTLGFAFEEQADPRTRQELNERRQQMQALADKYPYISGAFGALHHGHEDISNFMFEQGLELVLNGVELSLHKSRTSA